MEIYPSRVKMSSQAEKEICCRDFGTQLRQNHLAPYLREHEVKCKRPSRISEERSYTTAALKEKKKGREIGASKQASLDQSERGVS